MRSKLSVDDIRARLKQIKAFVVDQDGTAYLESQPFPWTIPFLASLTSRGIKYLFLSNNSSKSKTEHLHKLSSQGIAVADEQILSSSEATIEYLHSLNNKSQNFSPKYKWSVSPPTQESLNKPPRFLHQKK